MPFLKKLDVAYISYLYPNVNKTGGAIRAFEITKNLSKKLNLTVFVPDENRNQLPQNIDYNFVPFNDLPRMKLPSFLLNIRKQIKCHEYDIIHSNAIGGLFTEIDVVTFHHSPRTIKQKINKIPVYLNLHKASKILSVSKKTKMELQKQGYRDVEVVPNGISPVFLKDIDKKKEKKLKEKYRITNEKIILYINSNFTKRKNFSLMVETVKYLSKKEENFKLLMLGPKGKKNYTRSIFKNKNIEDKLIYVSDILDSWMPYHYSISNFLAVPSFQEGFGFPLIESLATGTPFVSFDVGVASELVEKGYGVIADDDEDFKRKCTYILNHTMVYDGSKDFIRKNYSWESSAESLIDIYKHSV